MHKWVRCRDEVASNRCPIAMAFWIIQIVSMEECSSLTQNLMQVHCCTCSVILNVTATQYTCSLNGIYHSHCLVRWSRHCSCMCIPVHSPWLPGYIDVAQTVFDILTMAGLFLENVVYAAVCWRERGFVVGLPTSLPFIFQILLRLTSDIFLGLRVPSPKSLIYSIFLWWEELWLWPFLPGFLCSALLLCDPWSLSLCFIIYKMSIWWKIN